MGESCTSSQEDPMSQQGHPTCPPAIPHSQFMAEPPGSLGLLMQSPRQVWAGTTLKVLPNSQASAVLATQCEKAPHAHIYSRVLHIHVCLPTLCPLTSNPPQVFLPQSANNFMVELPPPCSSLLQLWDEHLPCVPRVPGLSFIPQIFIEHLLCSKPSAGQQTRLWGIYIIVHYQGQ